MKNKFRDLTKPYLTEQTIYQFNQLQKFIDVALMEAASKKFNEESDQTKYLLNVLYQLRDFMLIQTNENSVRQKLINQFNLIEADELGNVQEEKVLEKVKEKLEQDQTGLGRSEEIIESTPNS